MKICEDAYIVRADRVFPDLSGMYKLETQHGAAQKPQTLIAEVLELCVGSRYRRRDDRWSGLIHCGHDVIGDGPKGTR